MGSRGSDMGSLDARQKRWIEGQVGARRESSCLWLGGISGGGCWLYGDTEWQIKHSQTDSGGRVVGISGFGLILLGRVVEEAKGEETASGDEPAVILRWEVR